MKRIASLFALALVAAVSAASFAFAVDGSGDQDHLICYKAKDPMTDPARFDLLARLEPEYSRAGCALVLDQDDEVRSEFCVPASKKNVVTPHHDPSQLGAPIADDYVCYRIECPVGAKPPGKTVSDQFSTRQIKFGQPSRICVPATQQPIACGRTGSNNKNAPICGGVCPEGLSCEANKQAGTCSCAPVACKGKSDSIGVCGGACTAPGTTCTVGADQSCICAPRGCGVDPASNQCGGACPEAGQECLQQTGGGCACGVPASSGCGLDPASNECGGDCPAGLFCLPPAAGGDGCVCRSFGGIG